MYSWHQKTLKMISLSFSRGEDVLCWQQRPQPFTLPGPFSGGIQGNGRLLLQWHDVAWQQWPQHTVSPDGIPSWRSEAGHCDHTAAWANDLPQELEREPVMWAVGSQPALRVLHPWMATRGDLQQHTRRVRQLRQCKIDALWTEFAGHLLLWNELWVALSLVRVSACCEYAGGGYVHACMVGWMGLCAHGNGCMCKLACMRMGGCMHWWMGACVWTCMHMHVDGWVHALVGGSKCVWMCMQVCVCICEIWVSQNI